MTAPGPPSGGSPTPVPTPRHSRWWTPTASKPGPSPLRGVRDVMNTALAAVLNGLGHVVVR
ncbi:hypothetical protein [Streptomyces sp. NPDC055140]